MACFVFHWVPVCAGMTGRAVVVVVGETLPFAERRGRVRSTQGMLEIPKDVPARRIGINNRSNVEAAWSECGCCGDFRASPACFALLARVPFAGRRGGGGASAL